ncbi:S9 family peptidase [Tessaracoccus sp. OH4464_COT-324]|uniref:alpha/beta hydrolase family protein n=1 Tax=Tessaracoccus sp. OH4464_COT-324 TaxID=2491059 RepID=UPI00131A46CC|nr:alpha/beta fold hydrolase [Tessaracoccus sp. OH4464_COT-324]
MPEDGKPIAVLLLWGSGPQDRDESLPNSPNKPLRDLAEGLADRGIASLRFDKRTFAAPRKLDLSTLSLSDEYHDDAAAALRLLRDRLPGYRLFVIGHSQGAMVLPDILEANEFAAGGVSLAGTPRSLFDLILDQLHHQLESQTGLSPEEQARRRVEGEASIAEAKAVDALSDVVPMPFRLSMSTRYVIDINRLDPAKTATKLKVPLLFLQGDADQQVFADTDYRLWQEKLAGQPNVEFELFNGLNHCFYPTKGLDPFRDIQEPATIPPQVIERIAGWLVKQA